MSAVLVWLKQRYERAFPDPGVRWGAYLLTVLVLLLCWGACVGCASTATRARDSVGGATISGALAAIGGVFGAVWAGVGGFLGALWASVTGADEPLAQPWQITLGIKAVTWAGLAVVAALVAANWAEWFPDLVRRKRLRRPTRDKLQSR